MKKSSRARFLCVGITASLLWWGAFHPPYSEAAESALNVDPSPSGLTVEAHGVGVEEVLREMGEKMGFTVVAKEAAYPVVNVSVKDATPEEALRQVLRGENYAIVYRRPEGEQTQAGKIDKILLLSPPNGMTTGVDSQPSEKEQARHRVSPTEQGGVPSEGSLPQQATAAVFGKSGWKVIQHGEEESSTTAANPQGGEESSATVANPQGEEESSAAITELLRARALQALAEPDQPGAEGNQ